MSREVTIEELKNIEKPFGLLDRETQDALSRFNYKDRQIYNFNGWVDDMNQYVFNDLVMRLNKNYKPMYNPKDVAFTDSYGEEVLKAYKGMDVFGQKIEVGDTIKVKKSLDVNKSYGYKLFMQDMAKMKGVRVTIDETFLNVFRIKEYNWWWTKEMFKMKTLRKGGVK